MGVESFISKFNFNRRGLAFCIFRTTCKEATNDKFVKTAMLVARQRIASYVGDRVYRRMSLIIIPASSWLAKIAPQKSVVDKCWL
jgi:hypothetical protein